MINEQTLGSMVVQITTDLENLNKGLKDAERMVKDTSGKIMEWTNKVGKTLTIVGAGITATMGLTVKAASDAQLSWARSEQFIKNAGLVVDDTLLKVKDFASEMQSLTGQNDELIGLFASRLIPITKDVGKAFDLTKAALDLSASGLIDLEGATKLFIGAADGNIGRLGMLVPALKGVTDEQLKHLTQTERLNLILQAVNKQYKGQAEIVGQTLAGQMNKFKNTLGDVFELIGGYLLPIVTDFLKNKLIPLIEKFKEFSEKHPELTRRLVLLIAAFGAFATALGPILIFLPQLVGAFATVQIAIASTQISLTTMIATLGVFLANITVITAGIIALTAAIWEWKKAADAARGAQEAQKNELEAGLKFTEAISKNLEGNLKTEKDLTDWQKLKIEGLKDDIKNYELYASSLLNKQRIDRQDIEAMREKLTHIIDESKALGDLTQQHIETSSVRTGLLQDMAETEKAINFEKNQELIRQEEEAAQQDIELIMNLQGIKIENIRELLEVKRMAYAEDTVAYAEYTKAIEAIDAGKNNTLRSYWIGLGVAMESSFATGLANMIKQTQSFSEAIKSIWTGIKNYIIDAISQMIAKWLLFGSIMGTAETATGGIFGFFKKIFGFEIGGLLSASGHKLPIPSAQEGLFIEGPPGPVPVLVHPPEVILPLEKFKKMQGIVVNMNVYMDNKIDDEIDVDNLASELGKKIKNILRES